MQYKKAAPVFSVPRRVKIELWVASTKGWLKAVLFVVFLLAAYAITNWAGVRFTWAAPLLGNPAVAGLVGALLGAAVGGVAAWVSSRQLLLQQFKAEASLAKIHTIYEPLYDGLLAFRAQIGECPYFFGCSFHSGGELRQNTVGFVEWTDIKQDSRYLDVPKWIATALDQFQKDIETYLQMREAAANATQPKIADIFASHSLNWYRIKGEDKHLLNSILTRDFESLKYSVCTGRKLQITDEITTRLCSVIQDECNQLEAVSNVAFHYEKHVVLRADQLISAIETVIQHLKMRYEAQDQLF